MASIPLKILSWLPTMEYFCGSTLECGADCSLFFHPMLGFVGLIVTVIGFTYHHVGKHIIFLNYIQWVFFYPGVLASVVVCFFGFLVFGCARRRGMYCVQCTVRENPLTSYFLLFGFIMSSFLIVWGALAFIRSFIEPGIFLFSDKKTNPYGKEVCEKGPKGSKVCRPANDEDQHKKKQWDLDHANDPVHKYGSTSVDACFSLAFVILHLYGMYPLVALFSYLSQEEEEDET